MNPTQAYNFATNLKAVHRYYRFDTAYDLLAAVAGSDAAATTLNNILYQLQGNAGTDETVTLSGDDKILKTLGELWSVGVRPLYHRSAQAAYCRIDLPVFVGRVAATLHIGDCSARLLLAQPCHMDYDTYIKYSPQWAARRWQRMKQDHFLCRMCGAGGELEVHHTSKEAYARLGREHDSDLLTVCLNCHDKLHGRNQRKATRRLAVGS